MSLLDIEGSCYLHCKLRQTPKTFIFWALRMLGGEPRGGHVAPNEAEHPPGAGPGMRCTCGMLWHMGCVWYVRCVTAACGVCAGMVTWGRKGVGVGPSRHPFAGGDWVREEGSLLPSPEFT